MILLITFRLAINEADSRSKSFVTDILSSALFGKADVLRRNNNNNRITTVTSKVATVNSSSLIRPPAGGADEDGDATDALSTRGLDIVIRISASTTMATVVSVKTQ